MDDLTTDERCDRCKKPFKILVKDLEPLLKDDFSVLCPNCETKAIDEEIEAEKPPKRCFEYKTLSVNEAPFEDAGRDGWELVAVDNGLAYFKRERFEDV